MTDKKTSAIDIDDSVPKSKVVTPHQHGSANIDIDEMTGDTKRMADLHNKVRKVLFPAISKVDIEKESAKDADDTSDDNESDFDFVEPRTCKIAKTNNYNRYNSSSGAGKWSLKIYAERLQGQLLLITARYRSKNMAEYDNYGYIFHAVKASEMQREEFEIFQKFHIGNIRLTANSNSDEEVEGEGGFPCFGLIMFVPKGTTDRIIYDYVDDLAIWMCHHRWSKDDSCVVHGSKFGKWRVDPNDWNETCSPKRKLGQVATISSACRALTGYDEDFFSKTFYQNHPKLASKYFDHPYSKELFYCLGYPKEDE